MKMKPTDIFEEWNGSMCALATMHGKERVIAPEIRRGLGMQVYVPPHFDTDQFGTFTGEIARTGNQLEAARKKALAAIERTSASICIASEGSFGAHPTIPFVLGNLELVLLIDQKNDIEVVGHYRTSEVQARRQEVATADEAVALARLWGFPQQGVIIRRSEKSNRHISKELTTTEALRAASEKLLAKWGVKTILLETDMRAHRCPRRMETIRHATIDLIRNCKSVCPICATPGFVICDVVRGLPCRGCGAATSAVREAIYSCQKCCHTEMRSIADASRAAPGDCQRCNP